MTLFNISLKNIRKSFKNYLIFFITTIFGVAIFMYLIHCQIRQ